MQRIVLVSHQTPIKRFTLLQMKSLLKIVQKTVMQNYKSHGIKTVSCVIFFPCGTFGNPF